MLHLTLADNLIPRSLVDEGDNERPGYKINWRIEGPLIKTLRKEEVRSRKYNFSALLLRNLQGSANVLVDCCPI